MKAIELITTKIFELKEDLLSAAKAVTLDADDDKLLADLAHWAASHCGENEEEVLLQAKAWAKEKYSLDLSFLRDILSVGAECNKPSPPWKFRKILGFASEKERDEWLKNRALITVHCGTSQIGGSITEIIMGHTKILVDFGSSLSGSQGAINDDDIIKKVFQKNYFGNHFDGVLFTHYHGDHMGLMDKIPHDVPIYMDETMLTILRLLHKHTGNVAMQELLANRDGRIHTFTPGKLFTVGDINIVPFFVDHSAYHANMFLFKGAGHTVLHSGDFRGTGYMSKSLDIIPELIRERYHKQVDALLAEGTMMNRPSEKEQFRSEWDVKNEAANFMRNHRQIFVICSSTNFDRITSICQAALTERIPIYAGTYIIEMLETFSDIAGEKMGLYKLPQVRSIEEYLKNKEGDFVILLGTFLGREKEKTEELYLNYGKSRREYRPHLIYSMWNGYLNAAHPAYDEGLAAFIRQFDGRVKYIHSAGHADRAALAKFIANIAPRKYIIPIHTENAAGFNALPIDDKYKDMIILPNDGDTIELE